MVAYYDELDKGSVLEPMQTETIERVTLVKYAGASGDYNPIHVDERFAVEAGKQSVLAHGMLTMAYLGRMVRLWVGRGTVHRFSTRFLRIVWPGDRLSCEGVVVDKREESRRTFVECEVWAKNQRGDTVAMGRVLAEIPRDAAAAAKLRPRTVPLPSPATPEPEPRPAAKAKRPARAAAPARPKAVKRPRTAAKSPARRAAKASGRRKG